MIILEVKNIIFYRSINLKNFNNTYKSRENPYLNINIDRFINDVVLIFTIFGDDFLPKLKILE